MDLSGIDIGFMAIQFVVLLFSLSIHEAAHAWMADRRGDYTARYMGRVSLNPLVHIDPIGTILFPILQIFTNIPLIGWAKPVPINPMHLKDPARDQMYISFAGPAANLLAGCGSLIILMAVQILSAGRAGIFVESGGGIYMPHMSSMMVLILLMFYSLMQINLMLAVFNLIPVPPLDGHWILAGLLPPQAAASFQRIGSYGIIVLYACMFLGIFRFIWAPIGWIIQGLL